jgi:hypothetical protein
LYDCLSEHPEVFLPDVKDVHYFRSWVGKPTLYDAYGIGPYADLFRKGTSRGVRLDISAGLLAGRGVAERLRQVLPDCRLIAILRNPIDRAISHYNLVSGRARLNYSLLDLVQKPSLDDPHEILKEGLYAQHLAAYFRFFPRNHFLILRYEDLGADPEGFFQRVCDFLGIDRAFEPSCLYHPSNQAIEFRLKRLYDWNRALGTFLLVHHLNGVRRLVKWTGLPGLLRRLNGRPAVKPPPDPCLRLQLADYYRADIRELEQLLGQDFRAYLE